MNLIKILVLGCVCLISCAKETKKQDLISIIGDLSDVYFTSTDSTEIKASLDQIDIIVSREMVSLRLARKSDDDIQPYEKIKMVNLVRLYKYKDFLGEDLGDVQKNMLEMADLINKGNETYLELESDQKKIALLEWVNDLDESMGAPIWRREGQLKGSNAKYKDS